MGNNAACCSCNEENAAAAHGTMPTKNNKAPASPNAGGEHAESPKGAYADEEENADQPGHCYAVDEVNPSPCMLAPVVGTEHWEDQDALNEEASDAETEAVVQPEPTLTYSRAEFPDGSVFEGQFWGQDRHGFGRFVWINGGSYEGQFSSNDMHGEGTYTWSDGSTYVGQWQHNEMGPKGVMRWTDGRRYEGCFDSGRKHGEGQLVWPDGRMYEGQWHAGKQHGVGLTVTGTGVMRKSQWVHGKLKQWLDGTGAAPGQGAAPADTFASPSSRCGA